MIREAVSKLTRRANAVTTSVGPRRAAIVFDVDIGGSPLTVVPHYNLKKAALTKSLSIFQKIKNYKEIIVTARYSPRPNEEYRHSLSPDPRTVSQVS
jgi:hypothetical protein